MFLYNLIIHNRYVPLLYEKRNKGVGMIKDEQYPHHICIQQDISNIQQTNKMNAFLKENWIFTHIFRLTQMQ